ncbi:LPS assembly lipoprotein LptE [Gilliamella sp. ESL0443]|uniref:LPS assembly lipoprotein LptE n=1 Tax=Gilliamella sp. ESL0443 TaxID=2704655 RepID=UPI001C69E330|nr:LPS assembly lipoprotein LptE [Gilliamella sp. ESL0443]QYN41816.1 LPS assembly lipoprotein LptE [Gilliamella sp. ESL0443]
MKKYLALLMLLAISLTGCGFHLQYETEVPARFKTLSYVSGDPYGRLSRNIKELLRDNKVTLANINDPANYPSLRIVGDSLSKSTISIYQDGKAAEYQLVLTIQAQVVIAGEQIHPINIRVFRTFFDNPAAALAKTVEQNLIEDEMYKQAAKQIIRKLKSVDTPN